MTHKILESNVTGGLAWVRTWETVTFQIQKKLWRLKGIPEFEFWESWKIKEYTSIRTTATNKDTSIHSPPPPPILKPTTATFWQWNLCSARLRIIVEEQQWGLIAESGKGPDWHHAFNFRIVQDHNSPAPFLNILSKVIPSTISFRLLLNKVSDRTLSGLAYDIVKIYTLFSIWPFDKI